MVRARCFGIKSPQHDAQRLETCDWNVGPETLKPSFYDETSTRSSDPQTRTQLRPLRRER